MKVARTFTTVGLMVTLATSISFLGATHASAEGVIQNPVGDEQYGLGYTGPMTVDLSGEPTGTYDMSVTGPNYTWEADPYSYDGTNPSFSQAFDPIQVPGEYNATVTNPSDDTAVASVHFYVYGEDEATVVSPSDGAVVFAPYSGPLKVRWASIGFPWDYYMTEFRTSWGQRVGKCDWKGSTIQGQTTTCYLDSVGPGTYRVQAWNLDEGHRLDEATLKVIRHLHLTDLEASPTKFYPLVRDGYRDSTRVTFHTNKTSYNRIVVKGRSGRTILHVSLGKQAAGTHSWRWNGRNGSGKKVDPGHYRIKVRARATREVKKSSVRVRVSTAWLTKQRTRYRDGDSPTAAGHSRHCFSNYHWWHNDDLYLDCWGGSYAVAGYRFRIPANAYNLSWGITGRSYCCSSPGKIAKAGWRSSSTRFKVGVLVTKWRSYDIREVRVHYYYRKRI